MSDVSSRPKIGWHPLAGIGLVVGLYLFGQPIGAFLVSLLTSVFGYSPDKTTEQFMYVVAIEALTIGGLVLFLKAFKAKLADIGFGRLKPRHVGIGLLAYALYFVLFAATVIVVSQLIPALDVDQEQQLGFDNVTGTLPLIITFISLVILPPIVEELTFRGMIFTSLRNHLNLIWTTLITSFIFAIAHLPAGGEAGPLYIAAIDTFLLSLVLCFIREKTNSLWPCITLHALKNSIAFISLYIIVAS